MRKTSSLVCLLALCLGLGLSTVALDRQMALRPAVTRLGFSPGAEALKLLLGDQRYAAAQWMTLKVIFYFGSAIDNLKRGIKTTPEYPNMYRVLENAMKLDPYNMDIYYFSEAAFTWEVGHAADVNRMLEYGMGYRTWDYQLPYFAGFNAAYFLKDYSAAARHLQRAAELSGNQLLTTLAARYFHDAGSTSLGIAFLETMLAQAQDPKEKKVYELRLEALVAMQQISGAVRQYREAFGALPADIGALTDKGVLKEIPADPYGGAFFLDTEGRVQSTSQLTTEIP